MYMRRSSTLASSVRIWSWSKNTSPTLNMGRFWADTSGPVKWHKLYLYIALVRITHWIFASLHLSSMTRPSNLEENFQAFFTIDICCFCIACSLVALRSYKESHSHREHLLFTKYIEVRCAAIFCSPNFLSFSRVPKKNAISFFQIDLRCSNFIEE